MKECKVWGFLQTPDLLLFSGLVRAWHALNALTRHAATAQTKNCPLSGAAGDHQQQALLLLPAAGRPCLEGPLLEGSRPNLLSHAQFLQWRFGEQVRAL